MSNMSKQEVIDEMISEGYDYDMAYRTVCGETLNVVDNNQEPNYEKAFDEFYGTNSDSYDDTDTELDYLARADEAAAYNENRERYMSVMRQDFPKDFADDDSFTAALLDSCENKGADHD